MSARRGVMVRSHEQALADGKACLAAALDYLQLGWSPLCVCTPDHVGIGKTHSKHCESPGKSPWGPWKAFQTRRPTERELRDKWHALPTANVGIALGPVSGLIRVDIDGPGGEAKLRQISRGDLPETLEFVSGRENAGRGLLYRIPPGVTVRTTIQTGQAAREELRFQAGGAQTVLPPSRHFSGSQYQWVDGHRPGEIEGTIAPDWLLRALASQHAERRTAYSASHAAIPSGSRNSTLASLAGKLRRAGCSEDQLHRFLLVENEQRCEPPLAENEVRNIARSIARYPPAREAVESKLVEFDLGDLADAGDEPELQFLPFLGRDGYVVRDWSHFLVGYPRCGKTELLVALCRRWLEEGLRIIYFSEEAETIWRSRKRQSEGPWKGLRVVCGLGVPPALLLERLRAADQSVAIVDTLRNLRIITDENDNAKVAAELGPWIAAARENQQTFLAAHHMRKSGGDHGEGIAGGHALLGAVDIALQINRDQSPTRRVVKAYARLIQPFDFLYERTRDGKFVALGDPEGISVMETRQKICQLLGSDWLKTSEVLQRLADPKPSQETLRKALLDEAKAGGIQRFPPLGESAERKTVKWRRSDQSVLPTGP
jgi:hypothetical protein